MSKIRTLRDVMKGFLFQKTSYEDTPLHLFCKGLLESRGVNDWYNGAKHNRTPVDIAAMEFYFLQHFMIMLDRRIPKDAPLSQLQLQLCDFYNAKIAAIFVKLVHYIFCICIRESRHNAVAGNGDFYNTMKENHPEVLVNQHVYKIAKKQDEHKTVIWFLGHPIDVSILEVARFLEDMFAKGNFGGAYGGIRWAKIAKNLALLFNGSISPIVFIDTAWTLAHNTGPIFDKGLIFETSPAVLKFVLDVQSAGYIPGLTRIIRGNLPEKVGYAKERQSHWLFSENTASHFSKAVGMEFYEHVCWDEVPKDSDTAAIHKRYSGALQVFKPEKEHDHELISEEEVIPGLTVKTEKSLTNQSFTIGVDHAVSAGGHQVQNMPKKSKTGYINTDTGEKVDIEPLTLALSKEKPHD